MPTAKTKGASSTFNYQPVSEAVNDTLAQKREYWRTKKREQRARLSKHRRRSTPDWHGNKPLGVEPFALENHDLIPQSFQTPRGTTAGNSSMENIKSQRKRWLDGALLQFSRSSHCVAAKAAASEESAVKCLTRCMKKSLPSGQAAAPPVNEMEHQPGVAQSGRTMTVDFQLCPKILATKVNAGVLLMPSSGPPSKVEGKETNTPPTGGTNSALVTPHTADSARSTQPSLDLEEQKTAKRREQWRLKKREQRAKLARAREKTLSSETFRQHSRVPSSTCLQEIGQRQRSFQVKSSFRFVTRKNKLQSCRNSSDKSASLAAHLVKRPGEAPKRLHTFAHLSSVSRGVARYKTPRKRFIEVQKNFIHQRNRRCKSPVTASVSGNRNAPKIDPSDTPEQKIAKQREYWRNKKREQRAKLSYEVKVQLKEKDSLMHRVKRYHKVLEELKCARAHSAGTSLTLASETIGGFIKEDGTMTNNVPQVPAATGKTRPATDHHSDSKQKKLTARASVQPPDVCPPPSGLLTSKSSPSVSAGRGAQLQSAISAPCTFGQLTLTHHPASAAEHHQGGCVMKMAISTCGPCVSTELTELTEEERMAKKREYWRIKKREQRAARAAQLKRSLQQAKITAASNRRKVQKGVTGSGEPLVRTAESTQQAQPTLHTGRIKQEREVLPEVDLNPNLEPDIKLPTPTTPPPEAWPPEPDPALGADSQTTTLMAVASMKKLLEESLTRVAECKTEVASTESLGPVQEDLDSETKPNLSPLSFTEDSDAKPIMPDTKSWHRDVHHLLSESTASHNPEETSHTSQVSSPSSSCAQSSQTPSNFTGSTIDPALPGHQRACFSEPPKLHHLPVSHQPSEPQCQVAQSSGSSVGGVSSLQKRREYWKLMKRQQRARLRAKQVDRRGSLLDQHTQAFSVTVCHTVEGLSPQADLQLDTGVASSSPINCELHKRHSEVLHYPVEEFWQEEASSGPQPHVHSQTSTSTDSASFLLALKPPDNPLFSINLQPIEPTGQTPNPSLGLIKIPRVQNQKLTPEGPEGPSNLVPPKLVPGDCEEDFLRRRREYWRLKKKEQRAKKATREKVGGQRRTSPASWRSTLPTQDVPAQDSAHWVTEGEPQHVASAAADTDLGSSYLSCSRASVEGEDAPLFWRSRYLMDYDPLNQLLVCMVCGELQYSRSTEAARGHIDEAHPDTLAMDEEHKQRILEAWDEQVSQREQFLISQLQQQQQQ